MTAKTFWRVAAFALPLIAAAPALAQGDEDSLPNDPNSLTVGEKIKSAPAPESRPVVGEEP